MKKYCVLPFIFFCHLAFAQELYVSTEPASNMAIGSIGLRINSKVFKMNHDGKYNRSRTETEIMIGAGKKLMFHIAGYSSDMFGNNYRFEGAGIYGKYRFFSTDDVHQHFRMAAFARMSFIGNPEVLITTATHILPDGNGSFVQHLEELHLQSNEIDLDGNNSGVASGIVATKLQNRFALSASLSYLYRMNNIGHKTEIFQPQHAIGYTTSAGLLLFPKEYTSYKQTNMNLYMELIGQSFMDKKQYYIDVAPAVQFIFNSIARLDLSYRTQVAGNINRLSNTNFMVRFEYNLLNVFGNR
jgi:hypothetical protein